MAHRALTKDYEHPLSTDSFMTRHEFGSCVYEMRYLNFDQCLLLLFASLES